MVVRFRDIQDPKSVVEVNSETAGVRRIVLETTRDDVTMRIENRLAWLKNAENFHYSGIAYGDIYPLPTNSVRSGMK